MGAVALKERIFAQKGQKAPLCPRRVLSRAPHRRGSVLFLLLQEKIPKEADKRAA